MLKELLSKLQKLQTNLKFQKPNPQPEESKGISSSPNLYSDASNAPFKIQDKTPSVVKFSQLASLLLCLIFIILYFFDYYRQDYFTDLYTRVSSANTLSASKYAGFISDVTNLQVRIGRLKNASSSMVTSKKVSTITEPLYQMRSISVTSMSFLQESVSIDISVNNLLDFAYLINKYLSLGVKKVNILSANYGEKGTYFIRLELFP